MHMHIQAAEGLHYGIVPYVSRPALGIVSGMVSAATHLLFTHYRSYPVSSSSSFCCCYY